MKQPIKFITAVLICELVGTISTPFIIASIPTWYVTLNKPAFSPPNWIFGPVWTILYLLMGISAYLVWIKIVKNNKVKMALLCFIAQLFLNFLWSIIFFRIHALLIAFINILILLLMILVTMMKFYPLSKPAAYVLIPYILWVSFAAILNFSIVLLN